MSSLYGSLQGERGEVTKGGHRFLTGHLRGWNIGIRVEARHSKEEGDSFDIYQTGGSSGAASDKLLLTVKEKS